ncbi:metallophosphoesterase family protein [Clostridium sp. UBA4395]|uniref:metallophosphoesterase family protein n=1 Tax=Clostridium sp. UBA4395 TaxID=1946360 RepID=UPI0032178116
MSIFIRNPYSGEERNIRTRKLRRTDHPDYRFIVMADSRGKEGGINEEVFRNILEEIIDLYPQPDYIIFPGDLVSGSRKDNKLIGQLQKFKDVFSDYYPIEILLPTVGNHEVSSEPEDDSREKIFAEVFSEFQADEFLEGYNRTAYYVDIGNIRLIVLNSFHPGESNQIKGRQIQWFERVSSEPGMRKLVFVHSPAFPTGHHIESALNRFPEQRDKFWSIVDKNNIDLFFAGHEHNYSRRVIDSSFSTDEYTFERAINQIVTGGAGAPLRDVFEDNIGIVVPPTPVYHYVIVDVYGDNLTITAISLEGHIIDEFNI